VADDFCERYGDLLTGSYDCVDRVVLNAYFPVGHNPGGFRCWWRRLHGGSDGYHVPPHAARTISALLTLRDHVIAPILAGVRSPRMGRKPKIWTAVDRDYETLRIGMQTLFHHVGIETVTAAV
jgi:hypothetical protein